MAQSKDIFVLVADSDQAARERTAEIIQSHDYSVFQAIDCGSAVKVLEEQKIDLAIIAQRMPPHDGFFVAKHIISQDFAAQPGMVMVTDDPSTDLLIEAGKHQIANALQKPVNPERLMQVIRRTLKSKGKTPQERTLVQQKHYEPAELMKRATALAHQNARGHLGGPFGAVVATADGEILGEGTNGIGTMSDPTAHAEVIAIRRATEKRGNHRLDGCVIYCSCEPTMLGQALIIGTGISCVYYGLSHDEIGTLNAKEADIVAEINKPLEQRTVTYQQLGHDDAMAIYQTWRKENPRRPWEDQEDNNQDKPIPEQE